MHRVFGNSNIFKNFKKLGVVGGGGRGGRVGGEEKWGVSGEMIDKKKNIHVYSFLRAREGEGQRSPSHLAN